MSKAHEELHRLVESLPPWQAELAKRLILALKEGLPPAVPAETAEDTEPLSPEEQAALERGRQQAAKGETISLKALEEELEREV